MTAPNLDEKDVTELVELLLGREGAPELQPLQRKHLPAATARGYAISLLAMYEIKGVNRLADNQELRFAPEGLTIIYGDNGVGKSGYARILKRACHAKAPQKILPNVFGHSQPNIAPQAKLRYKFGLQEQVVDWKDAASGSHKDLCSISVFDRECGKVHIRDKNEIAFLPFGLDIPDRLVELCQQVKSNLLAELESLQNSRDPLFKKPKWQAETQVGKLIGNLSPAIDPDKIRELATLSPEEIDRLTNLTRDLASDPLKAADEQQRWANHLNRLADTCVNLLNNHNDARLSEIRQAQTEAEAKRKSADIAARENFLAGPLPGVGTAEWKVLWEAARRYSNVHAYQGQAYPVTDGTALCLLCEQPLVEEARKRFDSLESFLQADIERQAQEAERSLSNKKSLFLANSHDARHTSLLIQLRSTNPTAAKATRRFLAGVRLRRHMVRRALESGAWPEQFPLINSPADLLRTTAQRTQAYATQLKLSAVAEERQKLENVRQELSDRQVLSEVEHVVLEEVARLKKI